MRRTEEQRRRWAALSPNKRRILLSHLPDDLERDTALCASVTTALENAYGPRDWPASAATLAEGEGEGRIGRWPQDPPYAMTCGEIGAVLGLSRSRVLGIIETALGKLRHRAQVGPRSRTWDDLDMLFRGGALGESVCPRCTRKTGQ